MKIFFISVCVHARLEPVDGGLGASKQRSDLVFSAAGSSEISGRSGPPILRARIPTFTPARHLCYG